MPLVSRDGRFRVAMAGRGDLYAILKPELLPLLWAMHSGNDLRRTTGDVGLSGDQIDVALNTLLASRLIAATDDGYAATFLIAGRDDVRRVNAHAQAIGRALAERLLQGWRDIEMAIRRLAIDTTTERHGFLLVGDRILDVGLLNALAEDGRLMPPAPARPTTSDPDARYYLWMLEGTPADLGRYGQRTTALPWPGWECLTFGEYAGSGATTGPLREREALEAEVSTRSQWAGATPGTVAGALGMPLFARADTSAWDAFARDICRQLLPVFRVAEPELRALWASLPAGRRRPEGFGEFICWYDHLAYTHAIDALLAAHVFNRPAAGFSAALWQSSDAGEIFSADPG